MDEMKDRASKGDGNPRTDNSFHQPDDTPTSPIQAQLSHLSLTEPNEILISEDGHPQGPPANPDAASKDNNPQNTIFILRNPTTLQNFLTKHSPTSITHIRLTLLHPLESVSLTLEEQRGSYGPTVTPLFAAWMEAFKFIPPTIQLVEVDISCSLEMRMLLVGRLAQHLSTTVWMRSGKKARFEVVGVRTEEDKRFVERGMVGLRDGVEGGDKGGDKGEEGGGRIGAGIITSQ